MLPKDRFFTKNIISIEGISEDIILTIKTKSLIYGLPERLFNLNAQFDQIFIQSDPLLRRQIIISARLVFVIHYLIFLETGIVTWLKYGNNLSRNCFRIDFSLRTTNEKFLQMRNKTEYITQRRIKTFSFWSCLLPLNGLKMFNSGVRSKIFYLFDSIKDIEEGLINDTETELFRIGELPNKQISNKDKIFQLGLKSDKNFVNTINFGV